MRVVSTSLFVAAADAVCVCVCVHVLVRVCEKSKSVCSVLPISSLKALPRKRLQISEKSDKPKFKNFFLS